MSAGPVRLTGMRFLHTSDWHLGRTFHGVDILAEQERALADIVTWVEEHGVDGVLVSGDVYDRAQPRTEVVELLGATLARLRRAGAHVVLTSGNHDSAARLGFGAEIMAHGGVYLRTRPEHARQPVLFRRGPDGLTVSLAEPEAADGAGGTPDVTARGGRDVWAPHAGSREARAAASSDGPGGAEDYAVAVYGIPYLEPRSVASGLGCAATHQAVLETVLAHVARDRAARPAAHSVVLAHAFVTGAEATDSERVIDSGGLGTVSADVFREHSYTALGHIHGPQRVRDTVRYSGSPVAYSFSEAGQRKQAWLVEIGAEGLKEVTALGHREGLRLARLRGTLRELLESEDHAGARDAWCQVVLTDAERPAAAMDRIRTRFPRTVQLRWEPDAPRPTQQAAYGARVGAARSAESLCAQFFEHVRHRGVSPAEHEDITSAVGRARTGTVTE